MSAALALIRVSRIATLALAAQTVAFVAGAATMPIDDSGTVTVQPTMNLRWQELSPRQRRGDLMEGAVQLRVRLNVKPWLGHSGRIYMVLPAQLPGDMTATWTTTGRLLPGRVQVRKPHPGLLRSHHDAGAGRHADALARR